MKVVAAVGQPSLLSGPAADDACNRQSAPPLHSLSLSHSRLLVRRHGVKEIVQTAESLP